MVTPLIIMGIYLIGIPICFLILKFINPEGHDENIMFSILWPMATIILLIYFILDLIFTKRL